ncbi:dehydrogenase/reductase SDR family member 12 [Eurytemora carolleeae]|uniref:dehydrogenase/reductase SDR family member 12 n=1 Tax=Eurytemora carolleeae TaxID=1294199 RepID=UPI000C787C86|nr:dehydrogenase/reductase SDR family member 12 [Eurytemora carolleeae]|eukprot:XP_023335601.1 dehydrogenase/reductase SDR family member 12-like [Eurytemora affinis]
MSLFRNVVWFMKGSKEYTSGGYAAAAKHFKADDLDVKCDGKSFMITGANSGIGKETALEIAKRGGTVHLVCRNPQYGEAAKAEIMEATGSSNVHLHILDMSQPKSVHAFTRKFGEENEKLDVLINNAGCMVNTRELQEDGLEKNFATNTLGTHIITVGLIDLLKKSSDPRVVIVSSGNFHTKMGDKLRTVGQGADTMLWLAVVDSLKEKQPSGQFWQDRVPVAKHLPLAWTKSSAEEEKKLMESLDTLTEQFK